MKWQKRDPPIQDLLSSWYLRSVEAFSGSSKAETTLLAAAEW